VSILIINLEGAIKINIKGTIKINYIHNRGYLTIFTLRDVLYIKESPINLILEGVLYTKGYYLDM
jgi:hypothetical protein